MHSSDGRMAIPKLFGALNRRIQPRPSLNQTEYRVPGLALELAGPREGRNQFQLVGQSQEPGAALCVRRHGLQGAEQPGIRIGSQTYDDRHTSPDRGSEDRCGPLTHETADKRRSIQFRTIHAAGMGAQKHRRAHLDVRGLGAQAEVTQQDCREV